MSRPYTPRGRSAGASLLELGVIIALIAILMVIATDRIWALRVEAERVGVMDTVGTLRSALGITIAARLAKGESLSAIASLQNSNPMALLKQVPADYIGELANPKPAEIPPHRWYFDRRQRMLIYRVEYAKQFQSKLGGPPRLRFHIALTYQDVNSNGRFDPHIDQLRNIGLRAVEPYHWTTGR